MVTVYLPAVSSRATYIVSHVFQTILGTDVDFTAEKETFLNRKGCCLNYSAENLGKGVWIHPHPIVYEEDVRQQTIRMGRWNELPCFFLRPEGDVPFDLFAASFYLLSRYEEYCHPEKDRHGRFPAEQSLAYKENFLEIPLVERWAFLLKDLLVRQEGGFEHLPRPFRFVSTFDIDHPYCYLNKGLAKNAFGGLKDLLKGDGRSLKERILTLLHLQADPYFSAIRDIQTLHQRLQHELFIFLHVGRYGQYDRRTLYSHRKFYAYIRSLYDVRLGLHPSYKASFSLEKIQKEKQKLEKIVDCQLTRNRQHFLRMRLPETYRLLNALHFAEDFTLAYASHPGFRASASIPFRFFDVEKNETTDLLVRPTVVMDATFIDYQKIRPEEAMEKMKKLMRECFASGGDFTMLWHNSNLAHPKKDEWFRTFSEITALGLELEKQAFPEK